MKVGFIGLGTMGRHMATNLIRGGHSLMVSDLPFQGPVGSVRIGLIGDRFIVCPTSAEVKESRLDLVISGTKDGIIMVEAGSREITEEEMLAAFEAAQKPIQALINAQKYAEVQIYPGRGHGISDPPAQLHVFRRVLQFFLDNL